MGFLDKAKKLAEQAQTKLDEAQRQFNERQSGGSPQGPVTEYDQHGRPVGSEGPGAPPAPDPQAPAPEAATPLAPSEPPRPEPAAPPQESSTPPHGDPLRDAGEPDNAPPKLTGGDPLAG
jgi:formin 2/WAS/WASL-interacting protein